MRERTMIDDLGIGGYHIQWVRTNPAELVYSLDLSYEKRWSYKSMADIVVPNFKERRARGEIFQNPMYSQQYVRQYQPAVIGGKGLNPFNRMETYTYDWLTTPMGRPSPKSGLELSYFLDQFEDERDLAVNKAWSNVDLSEMQALASLGEMPETIKWVGSLYLRAVNIVRMFRMKDFRKRMLKQFKRKSKKQKLSSSTDFVSDFWLELRYAVRPLMFEMQQAVTALKALISKAVRMTARGFDRVDLKEQSTYTQDLNGLLGTIESRSIRSSNYRAGVLYKVETDLNGLTALWGLDQPFETIWELTPFSFMIDWFFNVGDVIASWSVSPGISPLSSWITERHTMVEERRLASIVISSLAPHFCSEYGPDIVQNYEESVLSIYTRRIPNPSRYNLPHCRLKLDTAKIIDLATIGRGLIRGLKPRVA